MTEPRKLLTHLGTPALAWLLNSPPERVLNRLDSDRPESLEPTAETVLASLMQLDPVLSSRVSSIGLVGTEWRRILGSREAGTSASLGNHLRQTSGGDLPAVPPGLTPLEESLAHLAIDAYPSLLVAVPGFWPNAGITVSFHSHPLAKQFQELALSDEVLSALFTEDSGNIGPSGSTIRSTGRGGGHQLWLFAETLISSGWRLASSLWIAPSGEQVVTAVLRSLSILRSAVAGEPQLVPARVGLAGVLLPDAVDSLDFGWGRVRRTDERDQHFAALNSHQSQLTTTAPDGRPITISYGGDLVLEVDIPYLVRLGSLDPLQPWPKELSEGIETVRQLVQTLRIGLLLAIPERPTVIAPAWQAVLDPFSQDASGGSWDVANRTGLLPTQLTEEETNAWQRWTNRVSKYQTPSTDVALRRILMATSERQSADDVLVDAVVAWENLFGAATETTLRVTSSLAWLLGTSPQDRLDRQALQEDLQRS